MGSQVNSIIIVMLENEKIFDTLRLAAIQCTFLLTLVMLDVTWGHNKTILYYNQKTFKYA